MPYCPNPDCSIEVPADAPRCPRCGAIFEDGWRPLASPHVPPPPTAAQRVFTGAMKLLMVAIAAAPLFLGGAWAYHEHNSPALLLCIATMIVVIAVAIRGRFIWLFMCMLAAIPLGLGSCIASFKWHGG